MCCVYAVLSLTICPVDEDYIAPDIGSFGVFTDSQNAVEIQILTYADSLEEDSETIELVFQVGTASQAIRGVVEIRTVVVILNGEKIMW